MNIRKLQRIALTAFIASTLLIGSGCSKKVVDMPGGADGGFDGGTSIDYPAAQGSDYSESSLEGTLDDTSSGGGNLSVNNEDVNSDEYKKRQGRSSLGFSPVYFEFDQSTIGPDMADRMMSNSLFLKQQPGSSVIIEGNCDERGTNEYNLALGQRRAQNTKDYLVNLGVEEHRIRTISYGEEQPLFTGQDDFSYSQNRRADFILE